MKTDLSLTEYRNVLRPAVCLSRKKRVKLYIVGGILRDAVVGRKKENPDIDFCLKRGAIAFGRELARLMKAGFVVLDKEHGACRVVKKKDGRIYTLDFTDFRGDGLNDDLLHRDFTINCLAVGLEEVFRRPDLSAAVIDPYGGCRDIKSKIIKAVNEEAFVEDPLRILRAFSLASALNFKIGAKTIRLAKAARGRLSAVSGERIRDELFKILDRPGSYEYLRHLDRLKILEIIIPEINPMRGLRQGPYHHLDVLSHSFETLRQFEGLAGELCVNPDLKEYLGQAISGDRRRRALLKLGCLLHDIGKPAALRRQGRKTIFHGHERVGLSISEGIARRLRLSNDEWDSLGRMILWHLRPGYLADSQQVSARAKFRFFRDTSGEAPGVLLLSVSDQRATKGRLTSQESRRRQEKLVKEFIREYFRKKKEKKMPRLITGDDLIRRFRLAPSPLIGKILSEVEESQAIGRIKSKKEALQLAQRLI